MSDWRKHGWRMLAPGVYADDVKHEIHFNAEDFLRHLNQPITPWTLAETERIMAEEIRKKYGDIPIQETYS
jgi:hypothetical protein